MILVLTILLGVSLLFMTNENINKQKAAYGLGLLSLRQLGFSLEIR